MDGCQKQKATAESEPKPAEFQRKSARPAKPEAEYEIKNIEAGGRQIYMPPAFSCVLNQKTATLLPHARFLHIPAGT